MAGIVLSETARARGDRGAVLQLPRRLRGAVLLRLRPLDRRRSARELGWLLALRGRVTLVGKIGGGVGRRPGAAGFNRRQSLNAGIALIAHGEFTIILAQLAARERPHRDRDSGDDIVAFAGLYVLVTATVGIVLMKESKRLGRRLFPVPTLAEEARSDA